MTEEKATLLDVYVRCLAAFNDGGLSARKYGPREKSRWTVDQHRLYTQLEAVEAKVMYLASFFPEGTLATILMVEYGEEPMTYEKAADIFGYDRTTFRLDCAQLLECFQDRPDGR